MNSNTLPRRGSRVRIPSSSSSWADADGSSLPVTCASRDKARAMDAAKGSIRQRGSGTDELRVYEGTDPDPGRHRWLTRTQCWATARKRYKSSRRSPRTPPLRRRSEPTSRSRSAAEAPWRRVYEARSSNRFGGARFASNIEIADLVSEKGCDAVGSRSAPVSSIGRCKGGRSPIIGGRPAAVVLPS